MSQSDPTDFTGETLEPEQEVESSGPIDSMREIGSSFKHSAYRTLGIEDEEGEIDKEKRNLLAATGAVATTGISGALYLGDEGIDNTVEGAQETIAGLLGGRDCDLGYGITEDIVEDYNLADTDELGANADGFYIAAHDAEEDNWYLEGYTWEDSEPVQESVDIEDEKVTEILNQTGENYEWEEDVVQYCLEPDN